MNTLNELNLKRFPFREIPDEESIKNWIGSPTLKRDLSLLIRKYRREYPSSIQPIWGWYGAGKTHTLLHLQYKLASEEGNIIPIYSEISPDIEQFIDLYKEIMSYVFSSGLIEKLSRAFQETLLKLGEYAFINEICAGNENFYNGMHNYVYGSTELKNIIRGWFQGEMIYLKELKKVNITSRIESDADAINILQTIVKLIHENENLSSLVLLFDEFQRIGSIPIKKKEKIQRFFETLYNRCPNDLHLILAYSGRSLNKIHDLISPALRDRMGVTKFLSINILEEDLAILFIKELLKINQIDIEKENGYFPFTEEAIDEFVKFFITEKWKLKTRNIMSCCMTILEVFIYDFEDNIAKIINAPYVLKLLNVIKNDQERVKMLLKVD